MKAWSMDKIMIELELDKSERQKVLKELKRFLTMKGYDYKNFYRFVPGEGRQYFLEEALAKEFIEYYKRVRENEKTIIINEEYFKTQKSIKERLNEFEKELAKIMGVGG